MTLFDPGWRGEQTKGPEDSEWGVVDLGNDPTTIVERFSAAFVTSHIMLICLPVDQAHVYEYVIIMYITMITSADAVMQVVLTLATMPKPGCHHATVIYRHR